MSSIYRVKLRGPHHPHIFPVLNTRYIFWYILSRLPASDSLSIFNAVLPQREAFVWSGAGDSVITLQMAASVQKLLPASSDSVSTAFLFQPASAVPHPHRPFPRPRVFHLSTVLFPFWPFHSHTGPGSRARHGSSLQQHMQAVGCLT